jgi:hypothetical protein
MSRKIHGSTVEFNGDIVSHTGYGEKKHLQGVIDINL